MTNLYLIRHGEAMGAVQHIIGDTELSPKGIAQAQLLHDRLLASGEIKADVLIASTMKRARQTAEIIAPALGLPLILDDEVQEIRPGEAEGMTIADYKATFGEVPFEEKPFRPLAPGGESRSQFMLRVATALHRISSQHEGKTIVIVCHGGVIEGSLMIHFGVDILQPSPIYFNTRNTSITHWQKVSFNGLPARWRLMKYNDETHLRYL